MLVVMLAESSAAASIMSSDNIRFNCTMLIILGLNEVTRTAINFKVPLLIYKYIFGYNL